MNRRQFTKLLGTGCLSTVVGRAFGTGAEYPTRPIRMLAGFPAGGITDSVARRLGHGMEQILGRPVVIENKPGANSIIATQAAAMARADGYTLVFAGTNGMVLNPLLYKKLPYSTADFVSLGGVGSSPLVLLVSNELGVKNLNEFIELARSKPGEISVAHAGRGNINHLTLLNFEAQSGLSFQAVPYKGSSQALIDLTSGIIQATFDFPISSLGGIQDKHFIPLAVTAPERLSILPDVPTLDESGFNGFDVRTYMLVSAPKGLDSSVEMKLVDAVKQAVTQGDMAPKFSELGVSISYLSPQDVKTVEATQSAVWSKIVKDNDIVLD